MHRFSYAHRTFSSFKDLNQSTILKIPDANIYRFGDTNLAEPVLKNVNWVVQDGQSWAVIGSGSGEKTKLFQSLLGHLRISPLPPQAGLFPFLSVTNPPRDPHNCVSLVSFAHQPRSGRGVFYDYTSRYGAIRDEDRLTLRQSLLPQSIQQPDLQPEAGMVEDLAGKLGLKSFMDMPLITLSNGQTRRARILKALLAKPELLLLDEPLSGLDAENRPALLNLLNSLHLAKNPRIILGLRKQDPIPEWITHAAIVDDGRVQAGKKQDVLSSITRQATISKTQTNIHIPQTVQGKVLVDLKNVNVAYNTIKVLRDIVWTIREGDRWHLQGSNGSGKTTLLSLLTGDHPLSYAQFPPSSHLHLFGRPRSQIPTQRLRSLIGVVSPELSNAFPRRAGMTVWEAVGTGFDGGFVPYGKERVGVGVDRRLDEEDTRWRVERVKEVLLALGPTAWGSSAEDYGARQFVDISAGEQNMVLLMRALVGRPQLVLLDEVWNGMDDRMVKAAKRYLTDGNGVGGDQAVVVISHWEEEVPWGWEDGVKRFRLEKGFGSEVRPWMSS